MNQVSYLNKFYLEATPSWLLDIRKDSEIPWKEFFAERTVFYPGSAFDPYTVNIFTRSHSAHCFVNVDYHFSREKLEDELKKPMFPGYSIIYERNLSENVFLAMFHQPYSYITDFGLENFRSHSGEREDDFCYNTWEIDNFDQIKHFVKFLVFEKNPDNITSSAQRFALLYIGGDAFPVFNALYANKNANLFAILIEDYGWGCQYAYFRKNELLHRIAKRTGALPQLILTSRCGGSEMWDGYEHIIEDIDSEEDDDFGHGHRQIYKIKTNETTPKTILDNVRRNNNRDEGAYSQHCETYRQYTRRTKAGLPRFSEQEDILKKEKAEINAVMSRHAKRQRKLFWENFALIMRNRDKILKYPILSNIPMDSLQPSYLPKGLTLGALVFAWGASYLKGTCPRCQATAYYMPYTDMDYHLFPHCSCGWFGCEGEHEDHCYEDTTAFVRCSSCGEESEIGGDVNKTPRNLYATFYWLMDCWKHCHNQFVSKMSFEHAVHLLKLSEIYAEDPEDFLTGTKALKSESNPKKFSNVAATTEELISLVKGGKPYQLEEASKEELLNILHNYERLLDKHPDTYLLGLNYDDINDGFNDEFERGTAEDLSEEHLKENIELYEEQLKRELQTIEEETMSIQEKDPNKKPAIKKDFHLPKKGDPDYDAFMRERFKAAASNMLRGEEDDP
ncbi:hypothetical protein SAMN05720781_2182 [Fibrobacter sp. UWT3]|uniref:hypothetical protein n=1 Tax=Fibrobacter sp. UWT3 TaxID=1896225 RepID=UPI000BD35E9A|nr:hypothetical protein [Fibrobacter sp. UWT3]SOE76539.1 hypothetical protein SAMN05720781_2182 [Fibrobacter sp. UWT3]